MNAATGRTLENRIPFALQSAASALVAVRRYLIAATIAWMIGGPALAQAPPAAAAAASPLTKATYLWHGTVHAHSYYASQEYDGSPGKHAWTRKYHVVLLEIPSTSSRGVLVDGNWVTWPLNDLVPVVVGYQVEAFTDDRPYQKGPAHGGHVATGTASGTLPQSQLVKVFPNYYNRLGGTWGDMQRLVAPEAHPSLPSTWTRPGDYFASQGKAMESPGGYDVGFGLHGADSTAEENKAMYDGITLTYLPCGLPSIDPGDEAELETAEGFLRRMILEPVHIFGFLERPDQNQVSGGHLYNQHDPEPNYFPPQVLVSWDFQRIPYQPFVQIEYRQVQNSGLVGTPLWLPHNTFVDFLVGHKQAPIDVRIRTIPEDAAIQWSLAPEGNASGRIDPHQGTSKEFSFTPSVRGVRPTQGSQQPNAPIRYTLTVRNEAGTQRLARETIRQDTISIMRQEYVDYRRRTERRNVDFGLIPPSRARFGPIEPLFGNFTFPVNRNALEGNYLRDQMTLNGGWRDLAINTQRDYNGVIDLNSAYRNPQRNTEANGAALSIHMTGGAVDMDMEPQNVPQMVALHRAALRSSGGSEILLEREDDRRAGGNVLLPKNWGPPPASHVFTIGNQTVTVEDSDADDLPDRVSAIAGAPPDGIPSGTLLPYAGRGETNPSFQIQDRNRNNRIDVGEPLLLRYRPGEVHPLRHYYTIATHVHCATAEKPVEQRP